MKKKILVTGGTGRFGTVLKKLKCTTNRAYLQGDIYTLSRCIAKDSLKPKTSPPIRLEMEYGTACIDGEDVTSQR